MSVDSRDMRTAVAVVGLACLSACVSFSSDAPKEPGAGDMLERILAADNSGDVEAVMKCYSSDPVLMPPDDQPVVGRERVRERYAAGFERYRFEFGGQTFETRAGGAVAWSRGETQGKLWPKDGGQVLEVHDKFLMILERGVDGEWRIARLMWSPVKH